MKTIKKSNYLHNSKIYTQLTSDGDYFYHRHNFYEFFYIVSGEITHSYNKKQITSLKVGDLCVIPPNTEHKFLREEGNKCTHRDILIDSELITTCIEFLSPQAIKTLNNHSSCIIGHLTKTQISTLENEMSNYNAYRTQQQIIEVCFDKIFCINLLRHTYDFSININRQLPAWLNQLINTFQNTSLLKYDMQTLLKDCYFSKPYICKIFKKYVGTTMSDYLLQLRLNYAATLLRNTDMSINNIVSQIGISSIPYFNKTFKKMFNTTPSNYRKTNQ